MKHWGATSATPRTASGYWTAKSIPHTAWRPYYVIYRIFILVGYPPCTGVRKSRISHVHHSRGTAITLLERGALCPTAGAMAPPTLAPGHVGDARMAVETLIHHSPTPSPPPPATKHTHSQPQSPTPRHTASSSTHTHVPPLPPPQPTFPIPVPISLPPARAPVGAHEDHGAAPKVLPPELVQVLPLRCGAVGLRWVGGGR